MPQYLVQFAKGWLPEDAPGRQIPETKKNPPK
jgi:hypothetical protein